MLSKKRSDDGLISRNVFLAVLYILMCGFKTSGDAFRLPYSIAFGCSIRPFLDLFHSWLYIPHLSRFFYVVYNWLVNFLASLETADFIRRARFCEVVRAIMSTFYCTNMSFYRNKLNTNNQLVNKYRPTQHKNVHPVYKVVILKSIQATTL
jgi:hypothetical protein